ncbi:MAG: hypothetical protein ACK5YR_18550 [Pirellula sp.]|jgi:N-acetylneuraminate epimerase
MISSSGYVIAFMERDRFYFDIDLGLETMSERERHDVKQSGLLSFWRAYVHCAIGMIVSWIMGVQVAGAIDWREMASLPNTEGLAGAFAGVSNDVLIVAGGANFPDKKPWEGGSKVWYDEIYAFDGSDAGWEIVGKLPRPLGYGVSVSYKQSVICVGGSNAERHYSESFRLTLVKNSSNENQVRIELLPSLPITIANACGAVVGDTLYVVGGQEHPDSPRTLTNAWVMDLSSSEPQWREIEPIPTCGRMLSVAASFGGTFVLMGGVDLKTSDDGKVVRVYLSDAYRYQNGQGWQRLPDLLHPVAAAPSPAPADASGIYLLGGDDGTQIGVAPDKHRGFRSTISFFDAGMNQWRIRGVVAEPRVTVPCVQWHDSNAGIDVWVIPSGEKRPGVRSPKVWLMTTGTEG